MPKTIIHLPKVITMAKEIYKFMNSLNGHAISVCTHTVIQQRTYSRLNITTAKVYDILLVFSTSTANELITTP